MSQWLPLSRRRKGADEGYRGPFPGVPDWLLPPLWSWVIRQMPLYAERGGYRYSAVAEYRDLAMALRLSLDDPGDPNPLNGLRLQENLYERVVRDRDFLLDVADYVLGRLDMRYDGQKGQAAILQDILNKAGSVWEVRLRPPPHLEQRVSDEERAAFDVAVEEGGRGGELLALAWAAAYGREPDPTGAYRDAVRAVETSGGPVVTPQNPRQTLGTMIRDMEAGTEKWGILLGGPDRNAAVMEVVGMMRHLWKGQYDRHGTADTEVPIAVTPEMAQAAVELAVVLVRWFGNGTIRQAPVA